MNVLEKILEEIEKRKQEHKYNAELGIKETVDKMEELNWVCALICSMGKVREANLQVNDDWIPCSKQLPEDGTYLCTLDGELVGEEEPFTGMCGIENGKWDEEGCVIAWKPLPEAYKAADDSKSDWKEHMLNIFLAGH